MLIYLVATTVSNVDGKHRVEKSRKARLDDSSQYKKIPSRPTAKLRSPLDRVKTVVPRTQTEIAVFQGLETFLDMQVSLRYFPSPIARGTSTKY